MKRRTSLSESVELGATLAGNRPKQPPPVPGAKIRPPGPPPPPRPFLPRVQNSVESNTVTDDRTGTSVNDGSSHGKSNDTEKHKNKCCGIKLALFKQTNACGCMRYVMAVAQFILLFLFLLFETLTMIITFILTLGCYYYESPWYWYTVIDASYVQSHSSINNNNNINNNSSRMINSEVSSSDLALKNNRNKKQRKRLRVLSQNLWCHYLAPAPIKTMRMQAFIEWLRTTNSDPSKAIDVLLIQELFAVRFGPFVRGKHLVRVTVELHKLGYTEHSPVFGVLPWFGQNGGVIVFNNPSLSGGKLSHSRCVRYNQSDEIMLRKGYAISTLNYPLHMNYPNIVLATGHADPYRVEVMLSQYGDVAWGVDAQKAMFSGTNSIGSSTYENRLIKNINNKLEESPHQWRQYTTSNDDSMIDPGSPPSMTLSSDMQHSPQLLSSTMGNHSTTSLINNGNNTNSANNMKKSGYFLGVSAKQSVNNTNDSSPPRSISNFKSTHVIIAGDWNTRNIELMNGLPQIFEDSIPGIQDCFTILYQKSRAAGKKNKPSSKGNNLLTLIDIPSASVTKKEEETKQNMSTSVNTTKEVEELPCTYRSRYLSKSEILFSLFFCQPLPSLIGKAYHGHCLDHVFTDIHSEQVKQAEVIDSRDGEVFVSDHLGVMVSVELGSQS